MSGNCSWHIAAPEVQDEQPCHHHHKDQLYTLAEATSPVIRTKPAAHALLLLQVGCGGGRREVGSGTGGACFDSCGGAGAAVPCGAALRPLQHLR